MEIQIPTDWSDITLGQYIELRPILQTEQEDISRVINILCVLTGKKREEIKMLTIPGFHKLIKKLSFLNDPLPKELTKKRFIIGGKWYEFKLDAKKMLFGEYISVMELLQKANGNEDVIFDNLHKILTVICRPVYKTMFGFKSVEVDGEMIRQNADNFYKNMPITIAYPIGVFFYQRYPNLTQVIKTSLMEEANKKIKEVKTDLMRDGVGLA